MEQRTLEILPWVGTVNSPTYSEGSRFLFAWFKGKGCMTSGGHYVSKILLKPRNSCISFISLPSFCFLHLILLLIIFALGSSRLPRVDASGLVCTRSGFWDQPRLACVSWTCLNFPWSPSYQFISRHYNSHCQQMALCANVSA